MEEKDLLKRVEMLEKQQRSLLDSFSPIWHDYHKNGGLGYAVKAYWVSWFLSWYAYSCW